MEEKKTYPDKIDYVVHEDQMASLERTIKRLWILCIIIFVSLIVTNAGWIYYESQWEDQVITQEVKQDSGEGGSVQYNGKMVGIDNGETDNTADSQDQETENGR